MKVYIESMGCDSNLADTNKIRTYFKVNGAEIIPDYKEADVIILMSCGFNKVIMDDNLERLDTLVKETNAKVLLGGCIPRIKQESTKLVDNHFNPRELDKLDHIFKFKTKINSIPPKFNREDRKIIKISGGCEGKCSYCAIRLATGTTESRKLEDIKKDIEQGLEERYSRFVFTSEDIGAWGTDINTNIIELLKDIIKIKKNFTIKLTTINPNWFIKFPELVDLFKSEKIEKQVYLSLQSGSNRILKLMEREYTVESYKAIFNKLKTEVPGIKVQMDVIVGFPTEKEEDFLETLKMVEELDLYFLQVFVYTDMEGTPANKLFPKVPFRIAKKRAVKIIDSFLEKNKDVSEDRELVNTNIKDIHKLLKH